MKDAWVAFGGGSRVCIGVHLAMMELRLATFLMVQKLPKGLKLANSFSEEDVLQRGRFLVGPKGHKCMLASN